jgi:lipopolysaccharide/colanic/teichoic acid biosynthesis glycosyltransferase
VVLLPLIGVIAIAVAFTSGFPVFYIQKRVGRDGKIFSMFKFRTMVRNAHDLKSHLMHLNIMSGPFFKVKNDPRVTKMGKFLRKTSFDELPQLFNVLKGEMSLVGPRPMLPEEVSKLRCYDILSVRPGITGIWQVSGRNEIVNFQKKLAMDRLYVSRRSFTMDLALLFKTIFVVFDRRGAY